MPGFETCCLSNRTRIRRRLSTNPSVDSDATGRVVAAAAAAEAVWYTQRRNYRRLRRWKCDAFWQAHIAACRSNPRLIWQTVDRILGRCRQSPSDAMDVEQFRSYFDDKVGCIRDTTSDAPPPDYVAGEGAKLPAFHAVGAKEGLKFVGRLPDKSSIADSVPTDILKDVADLVAPYIAELFSRSLSLASTPRTSNTLI